MEKLRLLVTTKCPNKCPMCCNNSWDFSKLPVVEHFNYKEIMITGGEPLLFPEKLANLAESIKTVQKLAYGNWKIQCKLPPKTKRFCPLVLK